MVVSILITLFAFSCAIALDVTGTFSPSASVVKDNNVSLQCSWSPGARETALVLTIHFHAGSGLKSFYSYVINFAVTELADHHSRLSEDTSARNSTSMTMIIHNTQCMDEGNYYCNIAYLKSDTGSTSSKNNSQALYIKVPPKSPALTSVVPQNGILEGSFINVTCNANVGRPGNGSIQWRYYSNGVEVTSSISPQVTTKLMTLQSGDDPCTERWESTISLVANRNFQNLSLACYVVNTDFPVTQSDCTSDNYCTRTDDMFILYGVSSITVNSAPQSMNYEGGTTTLTCYADGYPKPSYTWTKEDDLNRTLTGIQDGDGSKIVLANLKLDQDDGTYNCKASNVVLGTLLSISSEVNVNVVATTTTRRTTTASATFGISTSVNTVTSGSADTVDTSQMIATTTSEASTVTSTKLSETSIIASSLTMTSTEIPVTTITPKALNQISLQFQMITPTTKFTTKTSTISANVTTLKSIKSQSADFSQISSENVGIIISVMVIFFVVV